jgi:hypothetical protein
MKPETMPDHLSRERIAALLDEPEAPGADREHLDGCEECKREYEQMVRMRMALSALPDLVPPADEWKKIRTRVGADVSRIGGQLPALNATRFRPLWAAAVIALFAAGLGVGRQLSPAGDAGPGAAASLSEADDPSEAYLRTVAEIQELRREGPSGEAVLDDPSLAAEHLMRLDALIEASQEALRTAPTDPILNNFLFDVVDERQSLAGQMDRSLRFTSVEY